MAWTILQVFPVHLTDISYSPPAFQLQINKLFIINHLLDVNETRRFGMHLAVLGGEG